MDVSPKTESLRYVIAFGQCFGLCNRRNKYRGVAQHVY